jgi:hypothetical protein
MQNAISFEEFLDIKEQKGTSVFVLLLDNELPHLSNGEVCWLDNLHENVAVVRLTAEEFKVLDYGVHPKTLIVKDGAEMAEFRGLPSQRELTQFLKGLKYGNQRGKAGKG